MQAGFGLVEVIVSITIMVVIVIALTYLSQSAFRTWETAQSRTVAYNLVQKTIEDLHNKRDASIAKGQDWTTDFATVLNQYKDPVASVKINNKDFYVTAIMEPRDNVQVPINGVMTTKPGLMKKFTITVKWKDRQRDGELKGETYLTDWKSKY